MTMWNIAWSSELVTTKQAVFEAQIDKISQVFLILKKHVNHFQPHTSLTRISIFFMANLRPVGRCVTVYTTPYAPWDWIIVG